MTKPLILYVEDDELSREIMALMIEDLPDYELVIFSESSNFMARVAALNNVPAIILLDIHVQPNDGFTMLEMLRTNPRYNRTPIVALTASVMNEEVDRLRRSGFNGAIAKPIDQDQFGRYIAQIQRGETVWSIINTID